MLCTAGDGELILASDPTRGCRHDFPPVGQEGLCFLVIASPSLADVCLARSRITCHATALLLLRHSGYLAGALLHTVVYRFVAGQCRVQTCYNVLVSLACCQSLCSVDLQ